MTLSAPRPRPRFHPRVDAGFAVRLRSPGRSVVARARDLSMAGCMLQGHLGLPGDRLTVELLLPGAEPLVTPATIRRRQDDAVAVEFDGLDWDDLISLARFVHPRL